MSALDKIRRGKRLTADFLYELLYGIANGDYATTNNNLPYWRNKIFYDHVIEGCIWTGDSYGASLNASMSAGLVMINGKIVSVDAIANRAFTASKDTYHYVDENGASTFQTVNNNVASPTAPANSILIGIIVSGATNILNAGSVNQGQLDMILPVISSEYIRGADSKGVPIYNTNPVQIEYIRTGTSSPVPTVEADVTGCTTTFTLEKPAKIYIDLFAHVQLNSGATRSAYWKLFVNGAAYTQIYNQDNPGAAETHLDSYGVTSFTLAAGTHTIKCRAVGNTGGTIAITGGFKIRIK
jgi:hypothetical protein